MARETRASRDTGLPAPGSTPHKRKRRNSPSPPPPLPPPANPTLKVVLPASLTANNTSPDTSEAEAGTKKQKISLKIKHVNGRSVSGQSERSEKDGEADQEAEEDTNDADVKVEEIADGQVLDAETRAALATIIAQMAVKLPSPLDGILSLWLPPSFEQKEENTLGYVLKQANLTWEKLVDILHIFAENLLVPCSYPNPMPSLAQFHQLIPPLPSHYRPHVIYTFCQALHALMLQVEPGQYPRPDTETPERWALMMKLPGLNGNQNAGEWFTSLVDSRVVESSLKAVIKDDPKAESLLASYAAPGDKFGQAQPVSVMVMGSKDKSKPVPLCDAIIQTASLKAAEWNKAREVKKGSFGSISRGVHPVSVGATSWTPSFAPTFDSSRATGGGSYYGHLDAMRERLTYNDWKSRSGDVSRLPDNKKGWRGTIEVESNAESSKAAANRQGSVEVDEKLRENVELIDELSAWQEVRLRRGEAEVEASSREQAIADALLDSLSDLVGAAKPAELVLGQNGIGFAHELSKRFIPVSSPSIRGTLDPRRTQAIRDNVTVKPRPAAQSMGGMNTSLAGGLHSSQSPSSYANTPQAGGVRSYNYTPQTPAYGSTQYRPPAGYTPSQVAGNPAYGRTGPMTAVASPTPQQTNYARLGPGPSNLRQSFGPGQGSPYGRNPATGLMSQVAPQYRM